MCKATPPLCYAGHHQSAMLLAFDQVYRRLYFVIINSAVKSGLTYPNDTWLILFINPSSSKCLKREPFFKDIGFSRFCLKPLSKFCFFILVHVILSQDVYTRVMSFITGLNSLVNNRISYPGCTQSLYVI